MKDHMFWPAVAFIVVFIFRFFILEKRRLPKIKIILEFFIYLFGYFMFSLILLDEFVSEYNKFLALIMMLIVVFVNLRLFLNPNIWRKEIKYLNFENSVEILNLVFGIITMMALVYVSMYAINSNWFVMLDDNVKLNDVSIFRKAFDFLHYSFGVSFTYSGGERIKVSGVVPMIANMVHICIFYFYIGVSLSSFFQTEKAKP